MTTLEKATQALVAEFIDKASRMVVRAGGDEAVLSTAGAWMQAGERLQDVLDLDRDDDTTRAEHLSLAGEVNYRLAPVVSVLRRALAAASGLDDPDDLTNLPLTVFLYSADVSLMIERLTAALDAVDPESDTRQGRKHRAGTEDILAAHWSCTSVLNTDKATGATVVAFACGVTSSLTGDDTEAQREHLAAAIDAGTSR